MRYAVCLLLYFSMAATPLFAAEATPDDVLSRKPLTGPLGKDMLVAVRGAARLGIQWLKDRQATTDEGIWLPPVPREKQIVVGYKDVEVTRPVYKTVTVTVPTRKRVGTKWVWESEKDPNDPYAPVGRRRVEQPVYEIVGTHQETRQVPDGDKTQTVTERRPIYERSDPVNIFPRWIEAQNALALYTLLRSGEPANSTAVDRAAFWLHEGTLEQHGQPDTTYEIALFIMCFSRLDKQKYGSFTEQLLEKLIRGQIADGDCRGFWGMYSVDFERMKALQLAEFKGVQLRDNQMKTLKEMKDAMNAAAAEREKARLRLRIEQQEELIAKVSDEINKLREKLLRISREFTRGKDCVQVRKSERIGGDVRYWPGALYYARAMQRADLTNTHMALLALRDAASRGYLAPESRLGKDAFVAVARAAHALRKTQNPDGSWGYGVQEIFFELPDPDRKDPPKPEKDPNRPAMSMTAAGLACLDAISEIVGRSKFQQNFGETIDRARSAALRHLDAYGKPGAGSLVPVCTQFTSLYYWYTLATAMRDPGLVQTRLGAIPDGVLCQILFSQQDDGSWPAIPQYSFGSSEHTRLHLGTRWRNQDIYERRFDHKLVNTCFALLLLLEAGTPSVGGQWHWSGDRNVAADLDLERVCDTLAAGCKAPLRWRSIPADLSGGLAAFVPALVVRRASDTKRRLSDSKDALGTYLREGGTLVVQPGTGAAATEFIEEVKSLLREALSAVNIRPLPEDHPAHTYLVKPTKLPEIEAAWAGDRPVAVFLPERSGAAPGLSKQDVQDVTQNLLGWLTKTRDLDAGAAAGPKDWDTLMDDLVKAVARLKEPLPFVTEPSDEPDTEPETGPAPAPEKPTPAPEKPELPPEKQEPPREKTAEELIREIHQPEPEPEKKPKPPREDETF